MIAMSIASILLMGAMLGYTTLARASSRLALAHAGLAGAPAPRCRDDQTPSPRGNADQRRFAARCALPERCEYDVTDRSCRTPPP